MRTDLEQLLHNDDALNSALRAMPRRNAPPDMTARLRKAAVQHRTERTLSRWGIMARRIATAWNATFGRLAPTFNRLPLVFEDVMRPLAVPALGGVFSAVTLFNLCVVPAYPIQARAGVLSDVPTQLTREATMTERVSYSTDYVVDITIDELGQVADCRIVSGASMLTAEERHYLEMMIKYYGRFEPATSFGKPTISKIRLQFSSIDVKG